MKKVLKELKKIFQHIHFYNIPKNNHLINPYYLNSYKNILECYEINVKYTDYYIDYCELNLSKKTFCVYPKYLLIEINKEKYLNKFYNKLPIDIINYTLSFF